MLRLLTIPFCVDAYVSFIGDTDPVGIGGVWPVALRGDERGVA